MPSAPSTAAAEGWATDLRTVAREWTRIGCVGFGGPPAHIALLRELCVVRRGWLTAEEFEDAIATANLLPGPGSTQLAIFCAWRVRGVPGALIGGAGFILPGLLVIVALASVFLADAPPAWIRGAGAAAGAATAAVALDAGLALLRPGWARNAGARAARRRWSAYVVVGVAAVALVGPWLVLVLLACGAVELVWKTGMSGGGGAGGSGSGSGDTQAGSGSGSGGSGSEPGSNGTGSASVHAWPLMLGVAVGGTAGLGALAWMALKVGALSYGGGFVIIPLMQADAVHHAWMTAPQFVSAVALGQVTPGPVTHTVAVVGYAAAGVGGAFLAAAVAFAPSFTFILLGADRFDRFRQNLRIRAFLDGAGPAAVGAIIGSAIPLARALTETWQLVVLAAAVVSLLLLRRGVVLTLLAAGIAGGIAGALGASLP